MKNTAIVWTVLMIALPIFGQSDKPKTAPVATVKTAPVISIEDKEKFFKAQSEYQAASEQMRQAAQTAQAKNVVMQERLKNIQNVCGLDYQAQLDKDGEPYCTEKPKVAEPIKK